jgi:hypothetical protein
MEKLCFCRKNRLFVCLAENIEICVSVNNLLYFYDKIFYLSKTLVFFKESIFERDWIQTVTKKCCTEFILKFAVLYINMTFIPFYDSQLNYFEWIIGSYFTFIFVFLAENIPNTSFFVEIVFLQQNGLLFQTRTKSKIFVKKVLFKFLYHSMKNCNKYKYYQSTTTTNYLLLSSFTIINLAHFHMIYHLTPSHLSFC